MIELRVLYEEFNYFQYLVSFDEKWSNSFAGAACTSGLPLRHNVEILLSNDLHKEAI